MAFFAKFRNSAAELKSIRCVAITSVLIALDIVLKLMGLGVTLPVGKINFAFLALSSIGMLYGPVVGTLAGFVTDILGALIKAEGLNPLYTPPEMMAGLLYGLLLYNFEVKKLSFSGGKEFFKSLGANWRSVVRIIAVRVLVLVICDLIMTPTAHYFAGYWPQNFEGFFLKWSAAAVKNLIKLPLSIALMMFVLYGIRAAYNAVFGKNKKRKAAEN